MIRNAAQTRRAALIAATALGLCGLSLVTPAAAQEDVQAGTTTLRLDAVDVSGSPKGRFVLFASFLDKDFKPVGVAAADAWTVFINGEPVSAKPTGKPLRESDQAMAIAVVMANYEAVGGEVNEYVTRGVTNLLNGLRNQDRSAVVAYGKSVETTGAALTPAHNEAVGWVGERKVEGLTPYLFDSIEKALELFPPGYDTIGPNRVIVVITDGYDRADDDPAKVKDRISNLKRIANDRNVHITVVGIAIEDSDALTNIKQLASYTGGTLRVANTPGLVERFLDNVKSELLGQYVLTLDTMQFEGGTENGFKVGVNYNGREYTSTQQIRMVDEKESHLWLYAAIGGGALVGLLLIFFLIRAIVRAFKNKPRDEVVEAGPDLVKCAPCGNMIPEEWKVCKYCEALPHYGRLTVTSPGPLNGKVFFIKESQTNIGSADGNNVVLPDKSVSKRHAGIKVQDNRFELADYGSTNHTRVNNIVINKQFLKAGDELCVGAVELKFEVKK